MNLELTEDQASFHAATRAFIQDEVPLSRVRDLYDDPHGFDRGWWARAAQLGWTSLFVPEQHGGGTLSGGRPADAVIISEEIGRGLAPGPFLPVNVVAAGVARDGTEGQQAALFPGLLDGDKVAVWAVAETDGRWEAERPSTTADVLGDEVVLNGTKAFVEALASADTVLVTAATGTGLTQLLVPVDTPGVTITPGRSVDITRRFGTVRFDEVRLQVSQVVGEVGGARSAVEFQRLVALALQCAELVGIADRTLEFTLEYGSERFAFGRPILSFQALKHRIADMAQWREASMAACDALAAAIDAGDDDAHRLAHVAKAHIGDKGPRIVDDCVQITGGIGVTWEHDIHMYNRRAVVNRAVYGTPEEHKEQLYTLLESRWGVA